MKKKMLEEYFTFLIMEYYYISFCDYETKKLQKQMAKTKYPTNTVYATPAPDSWKINNISYTFAFWSNMSAKKLLGSPFTPNELSSLAIMASNIVRRYEMIPDAFELESNRKKKRKNP